jgi:Flp pilus assembly protein TadD
LALAQTACRLAPNNGGFLNTQGIAEYRAGQYPAALATLTQADSLNGGIPADLAFLAMSHHQLGNSEKAKETLVRLRESLRSSRWLGDQEALEFNREATRLIEGE